MDPEQKTIRIGAVAILLALILRLLSGGLLQNAIALLKKPETAAFLLYLGTGRVLRTVPTEPAETEDIVQLPVQTAPVQTEPEPTLFPEIVQAVFAQEDVPLVQINNLCGRAVDIPALLQQPLSWNLAKQEPTVLILHTHACESYTNTENYAETDPYRTLDEAYNMVSVGNYLTELLESQGMTVLHDRTLHDAVSYNGAYQHARQTIADYLQQYPSIRLVLDLHRDAIEDGAGQQLGSTVMIGDQAAARLMLVVGTDTSGLNHPEWQKNLALAVKLHASLEKNCPGICRPVSFRTQRFNQDLSPGAMLIEVGAAGNTQQEAMRAVQVLAEGILELAHGSVFIADSTN